VEKNGKIIKEDFPTYAEKVNSQFTFFPGKTATIYYTKDNMSIETSGSWEFKEKKKILHVTFTNQYQNIMRDYEIIKFKNNILKLKFTEGGNEYVVTLSLQVSLAH
jgi:hypothetical protein